MPEVACTIVARNYLAFARVLARSFAAHHGGARLTVLLLDDVAREIDGAAEPFDVLHAEDIGIAPAELARMRMIYDVMELATAVKPWLLETLLSDGAAAVLYLDPDIEVFAPLDKLFEQARGHAIVLTPHVTKPMARDGLRPSEAEVMGSGVFNLGFIGIGPGAGEFLEYWKARLARDCVVDLAASLFVDQRWVDLVPALFDHTVVRDTAYNVAYWNIDQRDLTWADGAYCVDGRPLRFFHFSGYDPAKPHVLSKHQGTAPRVRCADVDALARLCDHYGGELLRSGYGDLHRVEYEFARMASGLPIDRVMRRLYRKALLDWEEGAGVEPANPFVAGGEAAFLAWLNEPVAAAPAGGEAAPHGDTPTFAARVRSIAGRAARHRSPGGPLRQPAGGERDHAAALTRYLAGVHASRPDLRAAFPFPGGADRGAFLEWAVSSGTREGIPAVLAMARQPRAAGIVRPRSPGPAPAAHGNGAGQPPAGGANGATSDVQGRANGSGAHALDAVMPEEWSSAGHRNPGAVVVGYMYAELGMGELARSVVDAVEQAGLDFTVLCSTDVLSRQGHPFRKWGQDRTDLETVICCINADQVEKVVGQLGAGFRQDRYTIGVWAWETEELPPEMHSAFSVVDEVWGISEFTRRAIASAGRGIPVHAFPLPVSPPEPAPGVGRASFGIPEDRPAFLFCFDYLSVFERKNPLGLLEAFSRAFASGEGPVLVVKTINSDRRPKDAALLAEAAARRPDVVVIDRYVSAGERAALMACADCYVSLHRAEGFGLTMAESMALGKPVIATAYSGNLDFMDSTNSFLVPFRFTEIPPGCSPYRAGGMWADPDLDRAAHLMRLVVADAELAAERGRRAAETIRASHGPEARARFIAERVRGAHQVLAAQRSGAARRELTASRPR